MKDKIYLIDETGGKFKLGNILRYACTRVNFVESFDSIEDFLKYIEEKKEENQDE